MRFGKGYHTVGFEKLIFEELILGNVFLLWPWLLNHLVRLNKGLNRILRNIVQPASGNSQVSKAFRLDVSKWFIISSISFSPFCPSNLTYICNTTIWKKFLDLRENTEDLIRLN